MISYEKLQGRIERMLAMGFLQHPNNMTWVLDLGQSTQYVIKTDFVNSAPDEDFRKMLSDVPISTPKLADHMLDRSVRRMVTELDQRQVFTLNDGTEFIVAVEERASTGDTRLRITFDAHRTGKKMFVMGQSSNAITIHSIKEP